MAPREPVVFIPGYPGIDLFDLRQDRTIFPPPYSLPLMKIRHKKDVVAALKGPEDPNQFDGVIPLGPLDHKVKFLGLGFGEEAKSLYDVLKKLDYDPLSRNMMIPVGWDWRLPVGHIDTMRRVTWAVDALFAETGRKVTILVHSTGGLVLRAYLKRTRKVSDKVAGVLSLGVPWAGALKTLKAMQHGSSIRDLSPAQVKEILGRSHAAYDVMPPDPSRTTMTWTSPLGTQPLDLYVRGGVQEWPLRNLDWLPTALRPWASRASGEPFNQQRPRRIDSVPVTNIVGWGKTTDTTCSADTGQLQFAKSQEGDGTVPAGSAAWIRGNGVTTLHVPYGDFEDHGKLWDSPTVRTVMKEVLTGRPQAGDFIHVGVDVSRSRAHFRVVATSRSGVALTTARFEVPRKLDEAITDPRGVGHFSLPLDQILGTSSEKRITVRVTWNNGANRKDLRVKVRR